MCRQLRRPVTPHVEQQTGRPQRLTNGIGKGFDVSFVAQQAVKAHNEGIIVVVILSFGLGSNPFRRQFKAPRIAAGATVKPSTPRRTVAIITPRSNDGGGCDSVDSVR
mmetsp:Transcript_27312/g.75311  ORF Transcript_27312/g.75311 Transcript_27312/m.75311 type:complete len:108 (+) Transcript_27312:106-429(+)